MISGAVPNKTTVLNDISFNGEKLCSGSIDHILNEKKYSVSIHLVYTNNNSTFFNEQIKTTISPSLSSTFISRVEYSSVFPPLSSTVIVRSTQVSPEIGLSNTINQQKFNTSFTKQCGQSIASNNASVIGRSEAPWLITIFGKFGGIIKFLCSGILISEKHALTTSNCFENDGKIIPLKTVSNLYEYVLVLIIYLRFIYLDYNICWSL